MWRCGLVVDTWPRHLMVPGSRMRVGGGVAVMLGVGGGAGVMLGVGGGVAVMLGVGEGVGWRNAAQNERINSR